jgi:aspartate/methionine/tyrosine aminotransferase
MLATLLENEKPGEAIINLAVGDPRGVVPDFVNHAHEFGEYPAINGTAEWREAAASWLRRRFALPETAIDPDRHILPLNGTREGLFLAPFIVTPERKNGERPAILLPNPFYQCYSAAALGCGAEPVFVKTGPETGWMPDYASLPKVLLNRTSAVFVCSPSNPEGAVASENYWKRLFEAADRHGFTVFADECYADIYTGEVPVGAMTVRYNVSGGFERLLTFHSLSKRSGMPGLRSGIVAGDPALLAKFRYFRNYAGPQVPMPIMAASAAAWRDEAHVEVNRAGFLKKFELARDVLGNRAGFSIPEGGIFLWLDVGDGVEVARRLWCEAGIRVLPGSYMGRETEPGTIQSNPGFSYIRVALVSDLSTIRTALLRIGKVLSET